MLLDHLGIAKPHFVVFLCLCSHVLITVFCYYHGSCKPGAGRNIAALSACKQNWRIPFKWGCITWHCFEAASVINSCVVVFFFTFPKLLGEGKLHFIFPSHKHFFGRDIKETLCDALDPIQQRLTTHSLCCYLPPTHKPRSHNKDLEAPHVCFHPQHNNVTVQSLVQVAGSNHGCGPIHFTPTQLWSIWKW